jgi:hypothetical protein
MANKLIQAILILLIFGFAIVGVFLLPLQIIG